MQLEVEAEVVETRDATEPEDLTELVVASEMTCLQKDLEFLQLFERNPSGKIHFYLNDIK